MSNFDPRPFNASNSPFKVDLCCNINIEVHVAMRLGELIKASRTEDKQLMALGYRLASAMTHLVDQLDNRQWDKLCSYMEEQESNDPENPNDLYVSKARRSLPANTMNDNHYQGHDDSSFAKPSELKDYVSSVMKK